MFIPLSHIFICLIIINSTPCIYKTITVHSIRPMTIYHLDPCLNLYMHTPCSLTQFLGSHIYINIHPIYHTHAPGHSLVFLGLYPVYMSISHSIHRWSSLLCHAKMLSIYIMWIYMSNWFPNQLYIYKYAGSMHSRKRSTNDPCTITNFNSCIPIWILTSDSTRPNRHTKPRSKN